VVKEAEMKTVAEKRGNGNGKKNPESTVLRPLLLKDMRDKHPRNVYAECCGGFRSCSLRGRQRKQQ
jgi:hypothetical protein